MVINLIPPKLKNERRSSKVVVQFFNFSFAYFILFCILTAVLFFANISIKSGTNTVNAQIAEATTKAAKYKQIETDLTQTNSKLSNIKAVEANRILWSVILTELATCTPPEAQVKTISSDSTKKLVSITGYAATRTDIAKFKDKMESSNYFKNVNFSTSSYDENKKTYTFNLSAELEAVK